MTEGGFSLVGRSTQKKKIQVSSGTFVNTSPKNTAMSHGAMKTIVLHYYGNDRRHGGYSRKNKMCDIFISRLVPETTARDVNNFLMPRLNRNVKIEQIEQMRTKYDNCSSFKLCLSMSLKNKVFDKKTFGRTTISVCVTLCNNYAIIAMCCFSNVVLCVLTFNLKITSFNCYDIGSSIDTIYDN